PMCAVFCEMRRAQSSALSERLALISHTQGSAKPRPWSKPSYAFDVNPLFCVFAALREILFSSGVLA
ncbi:MAG TPA: hypothetical protein VFO40_19980, partial [Chthoniobacterales bacterium]|nr:hypothetical protein [Chthoniobacterales bacterium]